MKCPECQFDNREGVKFCEECGAKFELECPACKGNIPVGSKFCGECGYTLIPDREIFKENTEAESQPSRPSTKNPPAMLPLSKVNESMSRSFSPISPATPQCLNG